MTSPQTADDPRSYVLFIFILPNIDIKQLLDEYINKIGLKYQTAVVITMLKTFLKKRNCLRIQKLSQCNMMYCVTLYVCEHRTKPVLAKLTKQSIHSCPP